jgi:D-sedoheptulose 7-phosphate isomerase
MRKDLKGALQKSLDDVVRAAEALRTPNGSLFIEKVAACIAECYRQENKILFAGNGGSLCDAMHFAEELTGQFREKRRALPAIALSDPGHMSCVGNDLGFEEVFARGVEALGKKGDLLIVLTTSGNSRNIVRAVDVAKEREMGTIAFLGKTGGLLRGRCDLEWIVSGFPYSDRVQEAHMAAVHIIIELVELQLFSLHHVPSFT